MCDKIVKREVRFALHLPKNDYRKDYHYVRLLETCKCGIATPRTTLIPEFLRPVWVTKKAQRLHADKKEFEYTEHLTSRLTTESDLNKTTAGLLGKPHLAINDKAIRASPYVYGYDISSTSLLKYRSLKKIDFIQTSYSVAAFDIETTTDASKQILMATVANKKRIHTSVLKSFFKGIPDPIRAIKAAMVRYLPEYKDIQLDIVLHDDVVDLLKDVFAAANDIAPDFLAVWNMDFDISCVMDTLKNENVNPVDVICDPSIPRGMRMCRYKRGPTKKVTASGGVKPINPSLQWHTLMTTSNFYVIDAMCSYRQIRMGGPEEPSYSLDAILQKELGKRKLKFEEADQYKGAKWHDFMQENYPVEYVVYNIFDCLGMVELDEETKDLSNSLPDLAGITDFSKFASQGKRLTNNLFLFGIERNRVIGTVPPMEEDDELADGVDDSNELDDELDPRKYRTLTLKGWIQMLQQSLLIRDGLRIFEDAEHILTNLRGLVADLDASSSYPSCTLSANVSKETCVNEIISILGVTEQLFREMNLSVCLGNANMIEYFSVMFNCLGLEEISDMIDRGEL